MASVVLTGRRGCAWCTRLAVEGLPARNGWPACADHGEQPSTMVGRVYLERGEPVTCVARWRTGDGRVIRNVLIRRAAGELVVRPFRGLRLPR